MKIGFIGTGAISEAMIRGMIGCAGHTEPIFVSKRSATRSARLGEDFQNVTVIEDNQEIVDQSDWVVLAVLPSQAEDIICDLSFSSSHTVISLVAGLEMESLVHHLAPASDVCRIIPLPPIEYGVGPIPLYPNQPLVADFFGKLGTVIRVEDESCFTVFSANSALMANFFEWTAWQARWMEKSGVARDEAALYASSFTSGLVSMTTRCDASQLQALSAECLTPGGLNEQVLSESRRTGWFDLLQPPLDAVLSRLNKKE